MTVFQSLLLILFPWLLTKLTFKLGTERLLSPVVLCFVFGIILCNFVPFEFDYELSFLVSRVTIILAIPLLLYSTDLIGWFKLAKSTIISFVLVIVCVIISAFVVSPLFYGKITDSWLMTGMLTGVFIGGTPNMNSVGIAMGADEATFTILNATELICGGIYLIFLTSIAHRVYGYVLKDFEGDKGGEIEMEMSGKKFKWKDVLMAIGLTVVLSAIALGITQLISGGMENAGIIILSISALSVAASFSDTIRNWEGPFELGEYLLLIFSLAIGLMTDLSELFTGGGMLLLFTACSWIVALSLHLLMCRLFKIDRDTMMITQTAGFYGPPFIGQIAAVIQNRALIFSGIMTGLVGLAVANFIGVAVSNLLKIWLTGEGG